ncbi:unnamed protein product [Rhodiola kirilowii]
MAYAMLNVPGSAILMRGINPKGLGFVGSELHGRHFPKMRLVSISGIPNSVSKPLTTPRCNFSASTSRPASQPRFIQHKKEAFWY